MKIAKRAPELKTVSPEQAAWDRMPPWAVVHKTAFKALPSRARVYLAMAAHANKHTRRCSVGTRRLAAAIGRHHTTVWHHQQALERAGLIKRGKRIPGSWVMQWQLTDSAPPLHVEKDRRPARNLPFPRALRAAASHQSSRSVT